LLPANGIITRGAGQMTRLRSIVNHLGLKTAVVAGEHTVLGLARLFDFTQITRPGFTSSSNTDLNTKVAAAHAALTNHDLVFLHIKGTDICAHDQDANAKREFLQAIDDALAPLLNEELSIAISGDHSTDSNTGHHTGDPVPSLICSPHGRVDNCQVFGETSCTAGALSRMSATGLITTLLDTMDAMHNYNPVDRPYFSFESC
jgi:2,3-bisphosphoglycerate-independent phosphoglycerate mutase